MNEAVKVVLFFDLLVGEDEGFGEVEDFGLELGELEGDAVLEGVGDELAEPDCEDEVFWLDGGVDAAEVVGELEVLGAGEVET